MGGIESIEKNVANESADGSVENSGFIVFTMLSCDPDINESETNHLN